jgi:dehydrogenase/reductase SDR family member 7B
MSAVIWITGASSGIGEALAQLFIRKGFSLIISARNEAKLIALKTSAPDPDLVFVLPLDLEAQADFNVIVQKGISAFGKIDILINNGGISQRSLAAETMLEVDRRIMEINYFGTIALSKAILPHFISNKSGHFVVVTSLVGKFGTPYRSAYAASKHALHGFFDSLRAEQHDNGIQVTLICPGFVKTQVSINALTANGSALQEMDEAQQNGISPEQCAKEIATAIKKQKREVLIGGRETFGVYLKRFFPGIFAKMLTKAKVR